MENVLKEPWEIPGNIWGTKSKFFSWLRGCLRRGIWEKNPIKLDFIKEKRERIPGAKEGTTRWGGKCSLCGELLPQKQLQVDHLEGESSFRGWEHLGSFVRHLAMPGALGIVCKPCHKIKTLAERSEMSFLEAKVEKEAIAITKSKEKTLDFLKEMGYTGPIPTNAKKRRELVKELLNARI